MTGLRGRLAWRRAAALMRGLPLAALLLVLVQVAYFAYGAAGITPQLWNDGRGFYFSENDVLHVGMIAWLAYVYAVLGAHLGDRETRPDAAAARADIG